jgi:SAM-dependent MidA family methyltransferase
LKNAREKIVNEIRQTGAISFARFMELALYCPVFGYYERDEDSVGKGGDFYTSPSVGAVFGELLAFQFADWLEQIEVSRRNEPMAAGKGAFDRFRLVECGAHRGHLAGDVLAWMRRHRPALFDRLEYWLVEPSEVRRGWQRQRLSPCAEKTKWVDSVDRLGDDVEGILFCNELLDAMPVHRWGWDAPLKRWFEWGVTLEGEQLAWCRMEAGADGPPALPEELRAVLPDGFILESCPAAAGWWRQAAGSLRRGRLVTIDYGLTAAELLVPERANGTLRAYRGHQVSGDLLSHPGEQDLTAHVNFDEIQRAGEDAGLKTECFLHQGRFLTGIAGRAWENPERFGEWTRERTRQFQTLTHPEHLGRAFRVLVQSRGV